MWGGYRRSLVIQNHMLYFDQIPRARGRMYINAAGGETQEYSEEFQSYLDFCQSSDKNAAPCSVFSYGVFALHNRESIE